MSTPGITVVICSLNGAETIGRTLDAIAAQTVPDVEVVVVDDGSSDGTADVARRHGARVVVHAQNAGIAAARNSGWRAAAAPLVAFTDDDCRPTPTWLERLLEARASDPTAAAVGGRVFGSDDGTFVLRYLQRCNPLEPLEAELLQSDGFGHRLVSYLRRSATRQAPTGVRTVSSIVGASMLIPVEVLQRLGGFDPRFRFGGEEEDFCRRALTAGEHLLYTPESMLLHDFEPGLADTLRRSRAYGRGNARMFVKYPQLLPTLYPLPALVAGLLGLAALRRSPVVGAAAAAAPALLFSHWVRSALRDRDPEQLAYPYLQLAQEALGNVGMLQELPRARQLFAPSPLPEQVRT
ncbi:glycosyltransferase family 2 protein [Angustibacter aerolatus]